MVTWQVDVLIGVTGSGLSNLAFLEPGAMVIELAARTYEVNYFDMLTMRVHGALLRGVITFRRSYVKAVRIGADDASALSGREPKGDVNPGDRAFNAIVNTTDVSRLVLEELQHRARGWWRAYDGALANA